MLALIFLASGGCGDGGGDDLPREPISGTVSYDGKPLANGTIQFQPASAAEGMAAGGMVVDGRFDVPRKEGPVPGKYMVQIDSIDETVTVPVPDPEQPASPGEVAMPGELKIAPPKKMMKKRLIPPKYNSQTELTAEVKAGGPNTYKFDLEK
jgi:hypothetical protein